MNPLNIINKYYKENSELHNILLKHSSDVAEFACKLARNYQADSLDIDLVYEASMLHDIGIFLTDAKGIQCFGKEPYILHGKLGAEILRKEGLMPHSLVAERHTGTGLYPEEIIERKLPLESNHIYYPVSNEEQIICYADKFFSKTKLNHMKSLDEVRKSMAKWGKESAERFEKLYIKFGL
ncbi:HD domain-containing protein [Falsiporphyromonas endometrii]|uniref:HD domain-containing protein n=1 Tax=Falsiporphyromonas endometrii TaxID=1387297 RepID=A0ABV9KA82_9PORP|nr:HDIG domain-containing protein [Porphyromonadaceae bacterium]